MRWNGQDPAAVEQAAQRLAAGELVAFPTETVYGLGARADDDTAVAKIFAAKGRPTDHPLIVHGHDLEALRPFAAAIPAVAQRLIDAFWPGPLTLIVPRAPALGAAAAGGQASIGLRCPAHPVARALFEAAHRLGVAGVAGPSANRFGRVSPTQAAHVEAEFGDAVPVLDGGDCDLGIESTIVDCTRGHAVLMRPGTLATAALEAAAREPLRSRDAAAPRAPGTLAAHYAPHARLRLMRGELIDTALSMLGREPLKLAVYSRSNRRGGGPGVVFRRMPDDALAAAHELFAVLRGFDAQGVQLIWVEEPPPGPEWDGVRDRLHRAAAA
jgi:L-threonylcarbamoyladenylate synthase